MSRPARGAVDDTWSRSDLARASILGLGALLALLNGQVLTPILPLMAKDLGVSEAAVGQLVSAAGAAGVLLGLVAGPLSDWTGRRPMLLAAAAVLAFSSAATAMTHSFALLLPIRFAAGVGAVLMMPALLAAAGDLFSDQARPRAMGVIMAFSGGSLVVGWPLAAVASARWNWQAVFVGLAIGFVALLALFWVLLPRTSRGGRASLTLLRQTYGRVLTDGRVLAGALAGCLTAAAWFGFMTYLGSFLASRCALPTGRQAGVLAAMGIAYSAASLAAGVWIRRLGGARVAIVASGAAGALTLALASKLGPSIAVPAAIAVAASRGAGVTAISDLLVGFRPTDRGTLAGLNSLGFSVGVLAGAGVGGIALSGGGYGLLFVTLTAWALGGAGALLRGPAPAESLAEEGD